MYFWDIVFILFGTVIAQICFKNNEFTAPFMDFVKSHVSCSENNLKKIEEFIMPIIGLVLILFFVHPQDVIAQISSGAAWNVGISAILNKVTKRYA